MSSLKDKLSPYIHFGDLIVLFTWATVFGVSMSLLDKASAAVQQMQPFIIGLYILYIVSFVVATREQQAKLPEWIRIVGLLAQIACAFGLLFILPHGFLPILTIIWVAVIAHFMRMSYAILTTIVVVISWFSIYAHLYQQNSILTAMLYASFHGFALMSHIQIVRQKEAQEALQLKHQELLATQHLLSEASKANERTRIARDLHDVLGHHLTALTINLQVAERLSEGQVKDKVAQCHSIAKLLLSDVREAVSMHRENKHLHLKPALVHLMQNVPNLRTHWSIDDALDIEAIEVAEVCLRLIQESLTNSMRHSGATDYYLDIQTSDKPSIMISIKDNGKCKSTVDEGNGMKGMRERVEQLGGLIEFTTNNGALEIKVDIPLKSTI